MNEKAPQILQSDDVKRTFPIQLLSIWLINNWCTKIWTEWNRPSFFSHFSIIFYSFPFLTFLCVAVECINGLTWFCSLSICEFFFSWVCEWERESVNPLFLQRFQSCCFSLFCFYKCQCGIWGLNCSIVTNFVPEIFPLFFLNGQQK